MRGALRGGVCGRGVHREPLEHCIQPRQQPAFVTVAQGQLHLAAADREVHVHAGRCLRQGRRGCWMAGCLSLAISVSHLGLDQLLCPSRNRGTEAMLAKAVWCFGEVLTVTMTVYDMVRCA